MYFTVGCLCISEVLLLPLCVHKSRWCLCVLLVFVSIIHNTFALAVVSIIADLPIPGWWCLVVSIHPSTYPAAGVHPSIQELESPIPTQSRLSPPPILYFGLRINQLIDFSSSSQRDLTGVWLVAHNLCSVKKHNYQPFPFICLVLNSNCELNQNIFRPSAKRGWHNTGAWSLGNLELNLFTRLVQCPLAGSL